MTLPAFVFALCAVGALAGFVVPEQRAPLLLVWVGSLAALVWVGSLAALVGVGERGRALLGHTVNDHRNQSRGRHSIAEDRFNAK